MSDTDVRDGELRTTASGEPKCPGCGEPMLHNSYLEQWECADAFFGLHDDGVLADGFVLLPLEDLTPVQRTQYEHWSYWIVSDAEWETIAQCNDGCCDRPATVQLAQGVRSCDYHEPSIRHAMLLHGMPAADGEASDG